MPDWYTDLAALARRSAREGDLRDDIGQALANLNTRFLNAPTAVLDSYSRLDESDITSAAESAVDRLLEGELYFSLAPLSDPARLALDVGAQLRALDEAHILLAPAHGPPVDPMVAWRSRDETHFLIPRPFGRGSRKLPARGDSYTKRGLLKHMVLPCEMSGLTVEIIHLDSLLPADADRKRLRFGASLIPELEMDVEETPASGFLVTGTAFPSDTAVLKEQVDRAFSEQCHVMVWPELTLSISHQDVISRTLASQFLAGPAQLQLVVAGSRHVAGPEGPRNQALILGGNGQPVGPPYDKVIRYSHKQAGDEAIIPGTKLILLATEIGIFSIGICRDFCELRIPNFFVRVPADFLLVPSLGNAETMRGHQDVAKQVLVANGTRAFVVQQDIPQAIEPHDAPADMLGYVLPPSGNPRAAELSDLVCTAIFSLHEALTLG